MKTFFATTLLGILSAFLCFAQTSNRTNATFHDPTLPDSYQAYLNLVRASATVSKNANSTQRSIYNRFASLVDGKKSEASEVVICHDLNTFLVLTSDRGSLIIDLNGRMSFIAQTHWDKSADYYQLYDSEKPKRPSTSEEELLRKQIELCHSLVQKLLSLSISKMETVAKIERILLSPLLDAKPQYTRGRSLVRVLIPQSIYYAQLTFSPKGSIERLDLFVDPASLSSGFASLFRIASAIRPLNITGRQTENTRFTLGTFFSPKEARFPIAAKSWGGAAFLDPTITGNPFPKNEEYPLLNEKLGRHKEIREFRFWAWHWWNEYGRVGGFCGNSLGESTGKWSIENKFLIYKSLLDYEIEGGLPERVSKGSHSYYMTRVNADIGQDFFEDLEKCNVAYIYTHAGPINGTLQIQPDEDLWVSIFPLSGGLGSGILRHLFIEGCATFTHYHPMKHEFDHLLSTWVATAKLDGLVTASGTDGAHGGNDRNGWRFFGYYNKFDSVCDSWAGSQHDEDLNLIPVTGAYADSAEAAISNLRFTRFRESRGGKQWVAFSSWTPAYRFSGTVARMKIDERYMD